MEATAGAGSQYSGGALPLSNAFLDAEISLAPVQDLLDHSDLDLNSFIHFGSRDMSPRWPTDNSSITDHLSADRVPGMVGENNSMPANPGAPAAQGEPRSCRNPQGCCISLATRVLSSIHVRSPCCLLDMSGQDRKMHLSRAVDAVFSTNQAALRAVRGMLRCSCSRGPQLLLIVTVICSEIIAWYWQIVDIYGHHSNSTKESDILPASVGRVETRRRPFFIGNHCLGQKLETALIRQVLSSVLQELQDVIGHVACNTGQSAAVDESRDCPILSGVRIRMDAFLHNQLRALRCALIYLEEDAGKTVPPSARH